MKDLDLKEIKDWLKTLPLEDLRDLYENMGNEYESFENYEEDYDDEY